MKQAWKDLNIGIKILFIVLVSVVTLLTIALVVENIKRAKLEKEKIDLVEEQKQVLNDKKEQFENIIKVKESEVDNYLKRIDESRKDSIKNKQAIEYWKTQANNRKKQIDEINQFVSSMDSTQLSIEYTRILTAHNLN